MSDAIYTLEVGEKYDYSIDMSTIWAGDTIASVVWTFPTGLTKSSDSNTTTVATVWVERTVAGELDVTALITSAAGRKELITLTFL